MRIFILLSLVVPAVLAADWGYDADNGPEKWGDSAALCKNGMKQSPIDIKTNNVTYHEDLKTLRLEEYDEDYDVVVENNGHTVVISLDANQEKKPFMTGGGLPGTFNLVQMHFHWGKDDTEGSEHTIDGNAYPLEIHWVHANDKYDGLRVDQDDGLAVLGFMFKIGDANNAEFDGIIKALKEVMYKGDKHPYAQLNLRSLLGKNRDRFFRYEGSLTTPNCDEAVTWTVFEEPIMISSAQLTEFRKLMENVQGETDKPMLVNYRPVQALNGRTIYFSQHTGKAGSEDPGYEYEGENGADSWNNNYAGCNGKMQSPINVVTKDAKYKKMTPFKIHGYNTPITVKLENNGHTVQVGTESKEAYITGGDLPGEYVFAQFHLHWGKDSKTGSEHTINGKSFPMEIHFVHLSAKYTNISDHMANSDGAAVLGFMFEIGEEDNSDFSSLFDALKNVQYKGLEHTMMNVMLEKFLGSTDEFYRYQGGLTTPGCNEVVTWSLFKKPIKISEMQMNQIRAMYKSSYGHSTKPKPKPIGLNYRPVQPLGDRQVYMNWEEKDDVTGGSSSLSSSLTVIIIGLMSMFVKRIL